DSTATWIAEKMGYKNFSASELSNPQKNIEIGCWYLRCLLDKYNGDTILALCAYNAGSGNVNAWLSNEQYSKDGKTLDNIPFSETRHYVANTQKYTEKYKKLYPDIF
ncbi:MAG: lytic transglycosylase domain-containing protein, partial [Ruminococcaceae bacterium]|nr:lytic transglycosylase domain-containing protein [Oscillospiraceae bacterium]